MSFGGEPGAGICCSFIERSGDPRTLVANDLEHGAERLAVFVRPSRRALVLGSAQRDLVPDGDACQRAGLDVARRSSGGGAVLVGPGEQIWLDVFLPLTDPLYLDDVGRSPLWLGEVWAAALADIGVRGAVVYDGAMRTGHFGRLACFAGLGPGEVSVNDKKLVGISQRRDRHGAWFHSMLRRHDASATLATVLCGDERARAELLAELRATTVHLESPADRLEEALVSAVRSRTRP